AFAGGRGWAFGFGAVAAGSFGSVVFGHRIFHLDYIGEGGLGDPNWGFCYVTDSGGNIVFEMV
ncbi:MAG: hypothetical protein KJZ79_04790, partial [Bryobacteraceae bacterium]|nr:hypothetical protein [Bryobacteraceae bacterium]